MRKFSLLLGTVGSTAAWYILSNKKLRTELGKAKTPEQTVKILTKYLGRDADKIGNAVFAWTQSDEFKQGVDWAKDTAGDAVDTAKKGLKGLLANAKEAAAGLEKEARKRMKG